MADYSEKNRSGEEKEEQTTDNAFHRDGKPGMRSVPPRPPSGFARGNLIIWLVVFLLITFWVLSRFGEGFERPSEISYSAFWEQVREENVAEVRITGEEVRGTFREPIERTIDETVIEVTDFVTHVPRFGDERLLSLLDEHNVNVVVQPESDFPWWILLWMLFPILFLVIFGWFMFNRMRASGQNLFNIRQSGAKQYDPEKGRKTFDDVAGATEAKAELEEIVSFLESPGRFEKLGGQIPKGVLLVGPPGTGKTLLAKAVAGEADVPFFSITGSDFMEMFVGVGASRVRNLFGEAKKQSPSIIFVDELDSIGRRRGAGLGGGHDEREQTLNQLLSELDGFEANEGVIIIAATNRPDILDPALLRPGRFDRHITVDLPTMDDRLQILKLHAKNKPFVKDIRLESLARATPGFAGADLANLLNEAALLAARNQRDAIKQEDIEEAWDKIILGLERKGLAMTDEELKMLAYHEAGHAVIAAIMPHSDPVHKVTIVPRGRAMGVTQQLPEREKYIFTREYMLDRLAVMLGGRAAEDLVFNTSTSGAENDLMQVTKLVRRMVLNWGMSDRFKYRALGGEPEHVFLGDEIAHRREYSDITAHEIDEEIESILDKVYERTVQTLKEHRAEMDRLAERLLEKEQVDGDEVLELLGLPPAIREFDKESPGNGEDADNDTPAEADDKVKVDKSPEEVSRET